LVLLKNKGTILSKLSGFKNILVAGQGANDIGMQCGGWTISWCVNIIILLVTFINY
jgi:beta-glucosidase